MKFKSSIFFLLISITNHAQTIDENRIPHWNHLGVYNTSWINSLQPILFDTVQLNNGFTANETFDHIFLNYSNSKIILPLGTISLTSPLNLPPNTLIEGKGADSTELIFNTNQQNDLISVSGTKTADYNYNIDIQKGDTFLLNTTLQLTLSPNDFIYICDDDLASITSNWAERSTGQFLRVNYLSNDTIYVVNPIRRKYSGTTIVSTINPTRNIGLSKFKITATEATSNQTSNIQFRYAVNCFATCLKSEKSNFAHITIENSSNINITKSEFKDGFSYGSGGKAYGVCLQFGTGDCIVENNYFNHLRHSILMQAGVNGNAIGYNYSVDPYWTDVSLPANSAGDIVFHGNYPYMNLVEGNNCQHIVIDDSHGKNGPYNTLLRNRSDLYGIFMNSNPATDSVNFIGNEVTNTGFLLGLYILSGNGHFTFGNNVKGTCNPSGTESVTINTLYLDSIPDFYQQNNNWPPFGYPNAIGDHINFVRAKIELDETICECCISTSSLDNLNKEDITIYPNPASSLIQISSENEISDLKLIDQLGNIIFEKRNITSTKYTLKLDEYSAGNYFLEVTINDQIIRKIIVKK